MMIASVRFTRWVCAAGLALAAVPPTTLAAQAAAELHVGVQRPEPRAAMAPASVPLMQGPDRPALLPYLMTGALFGGAAGALIGASTRGCDERLFEAPCQGAGAIQGGLIGAGAGLLTAYFLWRSKRAAG